MEKKPAIKLRVYRGREVNYDANGKIKNENHLVSLIHNTISWATFMKYVTLNGYCRVDVEKVFANQEGQYVEVDKKPYQEEVDEAFSPKKEVKNDAQKQIDELKKEMAEIKGQKKPSESVKKIEVKAEEVNGDDISELRADYEKKFKKKPFNGWNADKLREKLAE